MLPAPHQVTEFEETETVTAVILIAVHFYVEKGMKDEMEANDIQNMERLAEEEERRLRSLDVSDLYKQIGELEAKLQERIETYIDADYDRRAADLYSDIEHDATKIEDLATDDVAVYLDQSGSLVAVGDANGPWAVHIEG